MGIKSDIVLTTDGVATIKLNEQGSDPASGADRVLLYAKEIAGVTEFFLIDSDGTTLQLSSAGRLIAGKLLTNSGAVYIDGTPPTTGQTLVATASDAAQWTTPSGGGNVTGPGTSVAGNIASYADTTGTILVDSGVAAGSLVTLSSSAPTQITVTTASAGVGSTAARTDHVHSVSTAAPGTLTVGGSASAGVATSLSRSDHSHGMPSSGTPSSLTLAGTNSAGVASTVALSDHVHALPASATTPTILTVGGSGTAGVSTSISKADHVHPLPAFGTTSGTFMQGNQAAGGDATGTLDALTVTQARGLKSATTTVSVSSATAPTIGQTLTATSSTAATWQNPSNVIGTLQYENMGTFGTLNSYIHYAGSNTFFSLDAYPSSLYASHDGGSNWFDAGFTDTLQEYNSVAGNDTTIVAVGGTASGSVSNYIFSAPQLGPFTSDSPTWTARTTGSSYGGANQFTKIIWTGTVFAAIGTSAELQTSTDGTTWTRKLSGIGSLPSFPGSGTPDFISIAGYNDELVLAVTAYSGNHRFTLWYSANAGTSWSLSYTSGTDYLPSSDTVYINTLHTDGMNTTTGRGWLCTGNYDQEGTQPIFLTSVDPSDSWDETYMTGTSFSDPRGLLQDGVAHVWETGEGGRLVYTFDLIAWRGTMIPYEAVYGAYAMSDLQTKCGYTITLADDSSTIFRSLPKRP